MKTMTRRIISAILVLLLVAALLAGCASSKEREVTINVHTNLDHFVMLVAQKQGLFEKYMPEGVTIKYTSMTSGSEIRDALVAGQIDFGGLAVLAVATALQNDMPIAYVSYTGSGLFQLYAQDESIQSMADLNSSHKISVSSIGTNPHTAFLLAAQADGRNLSDFDNSMITMTNSDALSALISGTEGVDAVVSSFPTLLAAWQADNIHLVRDLADVTMEYGAGVMLCAQQGYIKENPDIIDAVNKAVKEAADFLSNDPETAIKIMMEVNEDCDHDTAEKVLDYYVNTIQAGIGKYDELMSFLYEQGILDQPAELFENIPKYEASK